MWRAFSATGRRTRCPTAAISEERRRQPAEGRARWSSRGLQPSTEPNPAVYEFGRLDRIQAFHADTLAAGAVPLRLHQDCWDVLREWVAGYITGEVSPDLRDIRSELIRELYT